MVEKDIYLNWPQNNYKFNQLYDTEIVLEKKKSNAICVLWDGTDISDLYGGNYNGYE